MPVKRTLLGVALLGLVALILANAESEPGGGDSTGLSLPNIDIRETLALPVAAAVLYLLYLAFIKVAPAEIRDQHNKRAAKRTRRWALLAAAALIAVSYGLWFWSHLSGEILSIGGLQ